MVKRGTQWQGCLARIWEKDVVGEGFGKEDVVLEHIELLKGFKMELQHPCGASGGRSVVA